MTEVANRHGVPNGAGKEVRDPRTTSGTRTKLDAPVVLVVDDVEDNVDLFASVLRDEKMIVVTAHDGVQALAIAAAERPLVVVTDLAMPVMDGFELVRRLRAEEYGARMYIITVSAFSDPATRKAAEAAGADETLAKPCAPAVLVERVRAAVAARQAGAGPDGALPASGG